LSGFALGACIRAASDLISALGMWRHPAGNGLRTNSSEVSRTIRKQEWVQHCPRQITGADRPRQGMDPAEAALLSHESESSRDATRASAHRTSFRRSPAPRRSRNLPAASIRAPRPSSPATPRFRCSADTRARSPPRWWRSEARASPRLSLDFIAMPAAYAAGGATSVPSMVRRGGGAGSSMGGPSV